MDLRKLRERPESELWQFKNARKNRPSPVIFLIMGTLLISAIIIGLTTFFWAAQREKQRNEKKYRAIQLPKQHGDETPASDGTTATPTPGADRAAEPVAEPSEMSGEARDAADPNPSADPGNVPADPQTADTSVDPGSENSSDEAPEADGQSENQMLLEDEAILQESEALEREATRFLVNHLQKLSEEKQVELLTEMKATVLSGTDPITSEQMFDSGEDATEAWNDVFNEMIQAGYTPPQGF